MKKRHNKVKFFLLLAVIVVLYIVISESSLAQKYIADPESLREIIVGFGILAPIAIILLQAFQTTISIIPSQLTTIIAGFIFGPILGLVYSLIGAFLGSAGIFSLSRKYGDEMAEKFFDKEEIKHFHKMFKKRKSWALFMARITPIFPNDLVSFAAGLTKMRLRDFNIISTLGFVVQMVILAYFGSELAAGKVSTPLIVISIIVSLMFLALIFKNKIKKVLIKDISKIEKKFWL